MDKAQFKDIVEKVITNLEGGYYNPAWHNLGDPRYASSGETMFGIDRKNGPSEKTAKGKEFWALIDSVKTKDVWTWNYKGGKYAPKLKELAAEIIYPEYVTYSNNWLKPNTRTIVENDPRLLFHMVYATWNGQGWFKKFAETLNDSIEKGISDSTELAKIAVNERRKEGLKPGSKPSSLIAQGGDKIESVFGSMAVQAKQIAQFTKKHWLGVTIMAIGFTGLIIALTMKKK